MSAISPLITTLDQFEPESRWAWFDPGITDPTAAQPLLTPKASTKQQHDDQCLIAAI